MAKTNRPNEVKLEKLVNGVVSNRERSSYAESKEQMVISNDTIPDEVFIEQGVNRGLRDINGRGVLTGLTNISAVNAFKEVNGERIAIEGELWYRGYQAKDLIDMLQYNEMGFEKIAYLLIFGELPSPEELDAFRNQLSEARYLPTNFTRDVIMKAPSSDIMNSMTKAILTLASYDPHVNDASLTNNIRQCLELTAVFPMLAAYSYHAHNHFNCDGSMYIHRPDPNLSTAENFLRMLRPDSSYTPLEAKVLDTALILHMEHGGGNNSSFTTRVVTSSGADAYAAISAAMCSLKGPRHGGANIKVMQMIADAKKNLKDITDKDEVRAYLSKLLDGKAFDKKGLIYGMGHAVYSISDPRERVLRSYVEQLASAKGKGDDMTLYHLIEELAPEVIAEKRKIYKGVSPNVDFYSGFVYEMLNIPVELYTPLFAIARIVGWSAHRLEELVGNGKIIRPAYKSVMVEKSFSE